MRLVPEHIFKRLADISAEFILKQGVKGLVLDIDNTMAPKQVLLPDDALLAWIEQLKKAQIKLFVISNNRYNRVSIFAKALDLPYIHTGMKPFPHSFSRAVSSMKLKKDEVAAVGDQIFTDVCGAHMAGIKAWLVLPIDTKETVSFRIRRFFEKPFIEKYHRTNNAK